MFYSALNHWPVVEWAPWTSPPPKKKKKVGRVGHNAIFLINAPYLIILAWKTVSSLWGGRRAPGDIIQRVTPWWKTIFCGWLHKEYCRNDHLEGGDGRWHHQLPPRDRVTPTLVTPFIFLQTFVILTVCLHYFKDLRFLAKGRPLLPLCLT